MTNLADFRSISGLSEIAASYRALFCDIWGVLHNGEVLWPRASEALVEFRKGGGTVILMTNAPRRKQALVDQLGDLGLPPGAYDDIVTSGDAARLLLADRGATCLYHVGADVHRQIYEGLAVELVDEGACEIICCTALFDDDHETPDDYRERLERWRARSVPMICANPDIVVNRGGRLVWCAGSLARAYEELGGTVEIVGKPYAPVYETAFRRLTEIRGAEPARGEVLAVGDGAETDLRGAAAQGIDAVFVTGGIHAAECGPRDAPDHDAVARFLAGLGVSAAAAMPDLAWR